MKFAELGQKMTDDAAAKAASKARHPAALVPRQKSLRLAGRCGSHDGNGHLCTMRENHTNAHKEQYFGGARDGELIAQWEW
jgi:hypothetical protein